MALCLTAPSHYLSQCWHKENSPVTQSWPHCNPGIIMLIRPIRPHCSPTLWCYSGVAWMSNLLKISSDMENGFRNCFFSTLYIDLEVNSISRTSISKVALKCIWCCSCVRRCAMVLRSVCRGGRFKNTYELLNLRALKFQYVNKIHIFQCMGKIFCVEFQGYPLKFHTKYLTHTLKDMIFMQFWNFKSS